MDKYSEQLLKIDPGVITDVLENLKIGSWTKGIHPTRPDMKIAGPAFTVKYEMVEDPTTVKAYRGHFDLLERGQEGDVIIFEAHTDGAMLGEHVIHAAINNKFGGLVSDGMFRDYQPISEMDFPTFCAGAEAFHGSKKLKPVAINVPIVCGGMAVNPGDYIVGDYDGLMCIPAERIDEVIALAQKVIVIEAKLQEALDAGCDMETCIELAREKSSLLKQ